MFALAILIGIYSYIVFFLGTFGFLFKQNIILATLIYLLIIIVTLLKKNINVKILKNAFVSYIKKASRLSLFFLFLIVIQCLINLIGALGPELGFDALWYHLTIPKIYLGSHAITYIPGGLLYYSAMPKLTEMLYVVGLAIGSEIFAKVTHFTFGILCLIALYKVSRKFLSKNFSLLVLILFYSNLVVGWISITAYIDLTRTFFEVMALWGFIEWFEKRKKKYLILSAIMLGLAISAKLLAFGTLLILSGSIIFYFLSKKKKLKDLFINLFVYWIICLLIPLPWFIFSYINTGTPVYPFFTEIYPVRFNFNLVNPLNLPDPISPLYVIFLPLALFIYNKFKPSLRIVCLYSFFTFIIWYLTPPTGGGRFILPYLPAFSILSIQVIKEIKVIQTQRIIIGVIIFMSLFSIIYRFTANFKYIPVIIGKESKDSFLSNNLNFSFGDFYDTDGYFAKKIMPSDKVLLYGFHNLYYVNFPFIDSSYAKKKDLFNYIAVQGDNLPKRFKSWDLIYYNDRTRVKFYSIEGIK